MISYLVPPHPLARGMEAVRRQCVTGYQAYTSLGCASRRQRTVGRPVAR
ncbi:MAG: hypothetical protein MSA13_06835 [Prevotella sp.]|nr:hypothetical protein [Prevotella sp.]